MNIVCFFEKEKTKSFLEKNLPGENIKFLPGPIQDHPEFKDENAEVLCVFVDSCVGKEELKRFPNVKLVSTRSTGFCHVETEIAKKKGVSVCNVPSYGQHTVAEFAFGLILSVSRKICQSYIRIRNNRFDREDLIGFDLKNKTIGIVGTGDIGAHVAKIAHGFGMKIIAFDLSKNSELEEKYDCKYVGLENLFAISDVITLHVPHNKHTHHLINTENISSLKKGFILINTARGGIVQTEAIVKGLKDGILYGAGLDVLEEETKLEEKYEEQIILEPNNIESLKINLANHYLIDHPQVVITPHNAFNSEEALERILETTVKNIKAFKAGKPQNIVCKPE